MLKSLKDYLVCLIVILALIISYLTFVSIKSFINPNNSQAQTFGLIKPKSFGSYHSVTPRKLLSNRKLSAHIAKTYPLNIPQEVLNKQNIEILDNDINKLHSKNKIRSYSVQIIVKDAKSKGAINIGSRQIRKSSVSKQKVTDAHSYQIKKGDSKISSLINISSDNTITLNSDVDCDLEIHVDGYFDIETGSGGEDDQIPSAGGTKVIAPVVIWNKQKGITVPKDEISNDYKMSVLGLGEIPSIRDDRTNPVRAVWMSIYDDSIQNTSLEMINVDNNGYVSFKDPKDILTIVAYVENVSQQDSQISSEGGLQLVPSQNVEITTSQTNQKTSASFNLKDCVNGQKIDGALLQISTKGEGEIKFGRSFDEIDMGQYQSVISVDNYTRSLTHVDTDEDGEVYAVLDKSVEIDGMKIVARSFALNNSTESKSSQSSQSIPGPLASFEKINNGQKIDLAKTPVVELSGEVSDTKSPVANALVSLNGELVAVANIDTSVWPNRWNAKVAAGEGVQQLVVQFENYDGGVSTLTQNVEAVAPDAKQSVVNSDVVVFSSSVLDRVTQFYQDTITLKGTQAILTYEKDSQGNYLVENNGDIKLHRLKVGDIIVADDSNLEAPTGFMARVVAINPFVSKTVLTIVRVFYNDALLQTDTDVSQPIKLPDNEDETKVNANASIENEVLQTSQMQSKSTQMVDLINNIPDLSKMPQKGDTTVELSDSQKYLQSIKERSSFGSITSQKLATTTFGADVASSLDIDAANEKWFTKKCDPHNLTLADLPNPGIPFVSGNGSIGLGGTVCKVEHDKMLCPALDSSSRQSGIDPKCPIDRIYDKGANPKEPYGYDDSLDSGCTMTNTSKCAKNGSSFTQLRTKFDGDGAAFAQVYVGPQIDFKLSIAIKWKWYIIPIPSLKYFKAGVFFGFTAKAGVYVDGGASVSFRLKLLKAARGTIPSINFMIVFIPVVLQPDLEIIGMVTLGVDGKFIARAEFTHGWEAGIEYTPEDGWQPYSRKVDATQASMTTNVTTQLKLTLSTKFGIYLYDVAGPYIKLDITPLLGTVKFVFSGYVNLDGDLTYDINDNIKATSFQTVSNLGFLVELKVGLEIRIKLLEKKAEWTIWKKSIPYMKQIKKTLFEGLKEAPEFNFDTDESSQLVKKGVTSPGTVYSFDRSNYDNLKPVAKLPKTKRVITSQDGLHVYAIDTNNDLWDITDTNSPQNVFGNVADVVDYNGTFMILTKTGNVYFRGKYLGDEYNEFTKVNDLSEVKAIAFDGVTYYCVRSDNTLWYWGADIKMTQNSTLYAPKRYLDYEPSLDDRVIKIMSNPQSKTLLMLISGSEESRMQTINAGGLKSYNYSKLAINDFEVNSANPESNLTALDIYGNMYNCQALVNCTKLDISSNLNNEKVVEFHTNLNSDSIVLTDAANVYIKNANNLTYVKVDKLSNVSSVNLTTSNYYAIKASFDSIDVDYASFGLYNLNSNIFQNSNNGRAVAKVANTSDTVMQLDDSGQILLNDANYKKQETKLKSDSDANGSQNAIKGAKDIAANVNTGFYINQLGEVKRVGLSYGDQTPEDFELRQNDKKVICEAKKVVANNINVGILCKDNLLYFASLDGGNAVEYHSTEILKIGNEVDNLAANKSIEDVEVNNSYFIVKTVATRVDDNNRLVQVFSRAEVVKVDESYKIITCDNALDDVKKIYALNNNQLYYIDQKNTPYLLQITQSNIPNQKHISLTNLSNIFYDNKIIDLSSDGNSLYAVSGHNNVFTSLNNQNSNINNINIDILRLYGGYGHIYSLHTGFDLPTFSQTSGYLYAKGNNDYSQLGIDGTISQNDFIQSTATFGNKVLQVVNNDSTTYVLSEDKTVRAFGDNNSGQLGIGSTSFNHDRSVQIESLKNIVKIAASGKSAIALDADGNLYGWGDNHNDQLGLGNTYAQFIPTQLNVFGVIDVSMYCVHNNQCGTYITRANGLVQTYGSANELIRQKIEKLSLNSDLPTDSLTQTKIDAYKSVSPFCQLTDDYTDRLIDSVIKYHLVSNNIECNNDDVYLLDSSGNVYTYDDSAYNQESSYKKVFNQIIGLSDVLSITAYSNNAFVISSSNADTVAQGQIYAVGNNHYGQLGINADKGNITHISRGIIAQNQNDVVGKNTVDIITNKVVSKYGSSFAIGQDGTVWAWGSNENNRLGFGNKELSYAKISKSDSNLGFDYWNMPTKNSYLKDIVDIAIGKTAVYALDKYGEVFSWGQNDSGQLGNNDLSIKSNSIPNVVWGMTYVSHISANDYNAYAVREDGTIYAWGSNKYGGLGINEDLSYITAKPLKITAFSNVKDVSANADFTLVLRSNGEVWSFGNDDNKGKLGTGCSLGIRSVPTQALVSLDNCINLKAQIGADGQYLLNGQNAPKFTQITTGNNFGWARTKDGAVYKFGNASNNNIDLSRSVSQILTQNIMSSDDDLYYTLKSGAVYHNGGIIPSLDADNYLGAFASMDGGFVISSLDIKENDPTPSSQNLDQSFNVYHSNMHSSSALTQVLADDSVRINSAKTLKVVSQQNVSYALLGDGRVLGWLSGDDFDPSSNTAKQIDFVDESIIVSDILAKDIMSTPNCYVNPNTNTELSCTYIKDQNNRIWSIDISKSSSANYLIAKPFDGQNKFEDLEPQSVREVSNFKNDILQTVDAYPYTYILDNFGKVWTLGDKNDSLGQRAQGTMPANTNVATLAIGSLNDSFSTKIAGNSKFALANSNEGLYLWGDGNSTPVIPSQLSAIKDYGYQINDLSVDNNYNAYFILEQKSSSNADNNKTCAEDSNQSICQTSNEEDGLAEGISILSHTKFSVGQNLDINLISQALNAYQPNKLDISLISSSNGKTLDDLNLKIIEHFSYKDDSDNLTHNPQNISASKFELYQKNRLTSDSVGKYYFNLNAYYDYLNPLTNQIIADQFSEQIEIEVAQNVEPKLVSQNQIDISVGQSIKELLRFDGSPTVSAIAGDDMPLWLTLNKNDEGGNNEFVLTSAGITPDLMNEKYMINDNTAQYHFTLSAYQLDLMSQICPHNFDEKGKIIDRSCGLKNFDFIVNIHGNKPYILDDQVKHYAIGDKMLQNLQIGGNPAPKVELLSVDGQRDSSVIALDDGANSQGPYQLFSFDPLSDKFKTSQNQEHIALIKASNVFGDVIKEFHFTVDQKPQIVVDGVSTVTKGSSSVLDLKVSGSPDANIKVVDQFEIGNKANKDFYCDDLTNDQMSKCFVSLDLNAKQLVVNNNSQVGIYCITIQASNRVATVEKNLIINITQGDPFVDLNTKYTFAKGDSFSKVFDISNISNPDLIGIKTDSINDATRNTQFVKLTTIKNVNGPTRYQISGTIPKEFTSGSFGITYQNNQIAHIEVYGSSTDLAFHLYGDRSVHVGEFLHLDLGVTGYPCADVEIAYGSYLPQGLELRSSEPNGSLCPSYYIEGVPKVPGRFDVNVNASRDVNNATQIVTNAISFNIESIASNFHPVGLTTYQINDAVYINLGITGNPMPTVNIKSGSKLPKGVSLIKSSNGDYLISGIAQVAGEYGFEVELKQNGQLQSSKYFEISIKDHQEAPRFHMNSLVNLTQGDFAAVYLGVTGAPCPQVKLLNPFVLAQTGIKLQGECGSDKGYHLSGSILRAGTYQLEFEASNWTNINNETKHNSETKTVTLVIHPQSNFVQTHIVDSTKTQLGSYFVLPLNITGQNITQITLASTSERLPLGLSLYHNSYPYGWVIAGDVDPNALVGTYNIVLQINSQEFPIEITVDKNNHILDSPDDGDLTDSKPNITIPNYIEEDNLAHEYHNSELVLGDNIFTVYNLEFIDIPIDYTQTQCHKISIGEQKLPKGLSLVGECRNGLSQYRISGVVNDQRGDYYTDILVDGKPLTTLKWTINYKLFMLKPLPNIK